MIKRYLYFKRDNIIEKGEIKNLYLFDKNSFRVPFRTITPIIENKFIHDDVLKYLIHPAHIDTPSSENKFKIKIGFLFSKDKQELIFGANIGEYTVFNPIVLMKNSLAEAKDKVSVFINGKKKLSRHFIGKALDNITILDFYPIIDTIFYNLKQFDAVLEKIGIIVSFKTDGG